jgi:hypothetical protein
MSYIPLIKIWSFDEQTIDLSLKDLITSKEFGINFVIKTESPNIYIKFISCLTGIYSNFLTELENSILADDFFLRSLEAAEKAGLSHTDILIKALQESNSHMYDRINELQLKAKEKYDNENSLLENTYGKQLEEICYFDESEKHLFYSKDPQTGEDVLLKANHIFQYKSHCYDIDLLFNYIRSGGYISLDEDYIQNIFDKTGKVDFSNQNLTTDDLKQKTYHNSTKVIKLNDNRITSLDNLHIPESVKALFIDNNPIGLNYVLGHLPNLTLLSMKNCDLEEVDFDKLPSSIINLNLSNNKNLKSIKNIKPNLNLKILDIKNTGIVKLNLNSFPKIKLRCDKELIFKGAQNKQVEIIYE